MVGEIEEFRHDDFTQVSEPVQGGVGEGDYLVKSGDCISSIAFSYGLPPNKIWDEPKNAELKRIRKVPNVLLPGDHVFIPDKDLRWEECQTEIRHKFRRKNIPETFTVYLKKLGAARANQPYELEIDGRWIEGVTDDEGKITASIRPNLRVSKLLVGDELDEYMLDFGAVDPREEIAGIQTRLENLGFYYGSVDGVMNAELKTALAVFQTEYELEVTAELNDETQQILIEIHDGG